MLEESKRIEIAIKASGLSYMDLEKITGISHSTIQRYAVGKTDRLPLSAIMKLADALNVSAPWIVGWDDLSSNLTSHETKVITAYRDQPEIQPKVDTLLGVTDNPVVNRSPLGTAQNPIRLAAYDGSDDQPAYTTEEQLDAAPDLEL